MYPCKLIESVDDLFVAEGAEIEGAASLANIHVNRHTRGVLDGLHNTTFSQPQISLLPLLLFPKGTSTEYCVCSKAHCIITHNWAAMFKQPGNPSIHKVLSDPCTHFGDRRPSPWPPFSAFLAE